MRGVALPLRLMAGGRVGRLVALMACALLAALAHPAVAPAKHGLVTGFADGPRYESGEPDRTCHLAGPDPRGEGRDRAPRSLLAGRRGSSAAHRSHQPRQRLLRLLARSTRPCAMPKPVVSSCSSSSAVPPPGLRGPNPPDSVPPRNLEAEPLRPRRLHAGGRLTLLGWIRPGWRRPGTAAPCRAGAVDSGLSPTSTTTSHRSTRGPQPSAPPTTGRCSTLPTRR